MAYEKEKQWTDGVVLIDKPARWTSYDVVRKMHFITRRKIGHAGTLDPLATGLLIICFDDKTKEISKIQDGNKEYTGSFFLGATTPSFDLEKEIDETFPTEHITEELIRAEAKKMTGTFQQTPPLFSAIQVQGRRAYHFAREGKEVEIKSREATLFEFEITFIKMPEAGFRIVCSKGFYVRSLARDLGIALQSGAYLSSLRRTRSGEFSVSDAWLMDDLVTFALAEKSKT